jgi:hypothetical protein
LPHFKGRSASDEREFCLTSKGDLHQMKGSFASHQREIIFIKITGKNFRKPFDIKLFFTIFVHHNPAKI